MQKTANLLNLSDNLSRRLLSPIQSFIALKLKRRAKSCARWATWLTAQAMKVEAADPGPHSIRNFLICLVIVAGFAGIWQATGSLFAGIAFAVIGGLGAVVVIVRDWE